MIHGVYSVFVEIPQGYLRPNCQILLIITGRCSDGKSRRFAAYVLLPLRLCANCCLLINRCKMILLINTAFQTFSIFLSTANDFRSVYKYCSNVLKGRSVCPSIQNTPVLYHITQLINIDNTNVVQQPRSQVLEFLCQWSCRNLNGVTPTEAAIGGGVYSVRRFSTNIAIYLRMRARHGQGHGNHKTLLETRVH